MVSGVCFVYLKVVTSSRGFTDQIPPGALQLILVVCDQCKNAFYFTVLCLAFHFLGLWETIQTLIKCRVLRRLIMVYTVCMPEFPSNWN